MDPRIAHFLALLNQATTYFVGQFGESPFSGFIMSHRTLYTLGIEGAHQRPQGMNERQLDGVPIFSTGETRVAMNHLASLDGHVFAFVVKVSGAVLEHLATRRETTGILFRLFTDSFHIGIKNAKKSDPLLAFARNWFAIAHASTTMTDEDIAERMMIHFGQLTRK